MSATVDPLESVRKRLLWRASRRGIKEMDIIIGGFASRDIPIMSEGELTLFESLLDIPDQQMLAFVTGQETIPADLDCAMLRALLNFRPEPNS
jgi:antitoxin CptB